MYLLSGTSFNFVDRMLMNFQNESLMLGEKFLVVFLQNFSHCVSYKKRKNCTILVLLTESYNQ